MQVLQSLAAEALQSLAVNDWFDQARPLLFPHVT